MIYTNSHVIVADTQTMEHRVNGCHLFRGWGLDRLTLYFSAARLEWLHVRFIKLSARDCGFIWLRVNDLHC